MTVSDWTPKTKEGAAEYLRGMSGTMTGVVSPERADRAKAIDALAKDVESFKSRCDPDVRGIVIGDLVRDIQKAHGTVNIPEKHLMPDYRKDIEREAALKYDGETAEAEKDIGARLKSLRAEVSGAILRARRLPSEAERIDPGMNHASWLQAALFDQFGEQRAEQWLEQHGDDERAVLERLEKSEDRIDGAFI